MRKIKEIGLAVLVVVVVTVGCLLLPLILIYLYCTDKVTSMRLFIKHKRNMKKMRKLVVQTALLLCKPNNTFTNLELKVELISLYPQYFWTQAYISQEVDELVNDGTLKVVSDNGTYRTYSDPNYVFPSQKPNKMAVKKAAAKKAMPKKAVAKKATVKKAGSKIAANLKKQASKAPAKVATKTVAKVPAKIPTKRISKTAAATLIENAKGRFGTATFIKKDNTVRVMNFQVKAGLGVTQLGHIPVIDVKLRKTQPNNCERNINTQTLKELKLNGCHYKVR